MVNDENGMRDQDSREPRDGFQSSVSVPMIKFKHGGGQIEFSPGYMVLKMVVDHQMVRSSLDVFILGLSSRLYFCLHNIYLTP